MKNLNFSLGAISTLFFTSLTTLSLLTTSCGLRDLSYTEIMKMKDQELRRLYEIIPEFEQKFFGTQVYKIDDSNRDEIRLKIEQGEVRLLELMVNLPLFDHYTKEVLEVKGGIGYIDGDIELGSIESLIEQDSIIKRNARNAVLFSFGLNQNSEKLWGGGIIPYVIRTSDFTTTTRERINDAIETVNNTTNLTLIPRTTQDRYIRIVRNRNEDEGSSPVGYKDSGFPSYNADHYVRLGSLVRESTIIHEFLHTAGIYHEQSRPDRDDFVTINFDCIEDGMEYNFTKREGSTFGPYDLNSRMHYFSDAFSRNGTCNTITANDGSSIGGANLTIRDIEGLQLLYNSEHGKDGTSYLMVLDKERDVREGFTIVDGRKRVIEPPEIPNDEIYGIRLRNIPQHAIIKVFDNTSGDDEDDWAEIIVKRDVSDLSIYNFERNSNANSFYKIAYNPKGGSGNLNGKVSRIEIDLSPPTSTGHGGATTTLLRPRIILKEGNNGTQSPVGTITNAVPSKSINFTKNSLIQNDEARSMVLYDIIAGTVIRVFDNSKGSKLDDWAEIIVKKDINQKVINTFERSFEDSEVRVIYFKEHNLDGKVSRLEVSNKPTGAMVSFYKGSFNRGSILAVLPLNRGYNINCKNNSFGIPNDDVTYLKLYNAKKGTRIYVFDSNNDRKWKRKKEDDWAQIRALRDLNFQNISTFERTTRSNPNFLRLYYKGGNLNGKVSYIQIRTN